MLEKSRQIFTHEELIAAEIGTPWKSNPIPYANEAGWILVIRNVGAATGTSPSMTWELDSTTDGTTYTRIGAAMAAINAAGATVVPYYTGSTQGAVPAGTLFLQLKCVFNNADNVFPDVSVDLVAMG